MAEESLTEPGRTWLCSLSSNHKARSLSHFSSEEVGFVLGIEPEISLFTGKMVDGGCGYFSESAGSGPISRLTAASQNAFKSTKSQTLC